MSVYRDKSRGGAFTFEFDRYIEGVRIRTRKRLPRGWSQAKADKFGTERKAPAFTPRRPASRSSRSLQQSLQAST